MVWIAMFPVPPLGSMDWQDRFDKMKLQQILLCASILIGEFIFSLGPTTRAGLEHTLSLLFKKIQRAEFREASSLKQSMRLSWHLKNGV